MEEIGEYILRKIEEVIKDDKGKLYFLTKFSPNILLKVKQLSQTSDYLKSEKWKIFLLCPPDSETNFLEKQLNLDYLAKACSPDHAAKFRDTEKVIYLYPSLISQIISETISLNTALDLSKLEILPINCLLDHVGIIFCKNGWEKDILESVKAMIERTSPSDNEDQEFEEFYMCILNELKAIDLEKTLRRLIGVCGLLPDSQIENYLRNPNNGRKNKLKRRFKDNLGVFKNTLKKWNNNKLIFLEELKVINSSKAEKLENFLKRQDSTNLVSYERSVKAKRYLTEKWPYELDFDFLSGRVESDIFIKNIDFENEFDDFYGRYKICYSKTQALAFLGNKSTDDSQIAVDVVFSLNGRQYYKSENVAGEAGWKFELPELELGNKCKFNILTHPPKRSGDFRPKSMINELKVKISGSEDDENIKFLFVDENKLPFFIAIEPECVLAMDVNEWFGKEVDVLVSRVGNISWKNIDPDKRIEINRKESGVDINVGEKIVIIVDGEQSIVLNLIRSDIGNGDGENIQCEGVLSQFEAKRNYLTDFSENLNDPDINEFRIKRQKNIFSIWINGNQRKKYAPKSISFPGKFGNWLIDIIDQAENDRDKNFLPLGCTTYNEKLKPLDPIEIEWNDHQDKIMNLKYSKPFLEARRNYFKSLKIRLRDYGYINESCRFCDFVLIRDEIINYAKSYLDLLVEAMEKSEYKYKSLMWLFFCMDSVVEFDSVSNTKKEVLSPTIEEIGMAKIHIGATHPIRAMWCLKKALYLQKVLGRIAKAPKSLFSNDLEDFIDGFGIPQYILISDNTDRLKPFVNVSTNDWGAWATYCPENKVSEAMSNMSFSGEAKAESTLTSREIQFAINKYQNAQPFRGRIIINLPNAGKAGHLLEAFLKLHREKKSKQYRIIFPENPDVKNNLFTLRDPKQRHELPENIEIIYEKDEAQENSHILFSSTPSQFNTSGFYSFVKDIQQNALVDGCITWKFTSFKMDGASGGNIDSSRIYFRDKINGDDIENKIFSDLLNWLQRIVLNPKENSPITREQTLCVRTQRVPIEKAFHNKVINEHNISHWVFSHNKDLDVEFFDLENEPYIVDYDPGQSELIVTSQDNDGIIKNYIKKGLRGSGVQSEDITSDVVDEVFDAVNRFSGRSLIKVITDFSDLKGVIGLSLARLWLLKQGSLPPYEKDPNLVVEEAGIIISLDDYDSVWRKLIPDEKEKNRADLLWCFFKKNGEHFEIHLEVIEVKNREGAALPGWEFQVYNSYKMINKIFALSDEETVADIEVARLRFTLIVDLHLRRHFRQIFQTDEEKIALGEEFRVNLISAICGGKCKIYFGQDKKVKIVGRILHFNTSHVTSNVKQNNSASIEYQQINTLEALGIAKKTISKKADSGNLIDKQKLISNLNDRDSESNKIIIKGHGNIIEKYKDLLVVGSNNIDKVGLLGKYNDKYIGYDLGHPKATAIFGMMGSGKSYAVGVMIENACMVGQDINNLEEPLHVIIFNYRKDSKTRFEYSSMLDINNVESEVECLRSAYGIEPTLLKDMSVFCYEREIPIKCDSDYKGISNIYPLKFDPMMLNADMWNLMMGIPDKDSLYTAELRDIIADLYYDELLTFENIEDRVKHSNLTRSQQRLAQQRLKKVGPYIGTSDTIKIAEVVNGAQVTIIDLRAQNLTRDDAIRLCLVTLSQVENVFNKLIVFDEAHEYFQKDFTEKIENMLTQIRHQGSQFILAVQDPSRISTDILKFCDVRIVFHLNQHLIKNLKDYVPAFSQLSDSEILNLQKSKGECFLQADTSMENYFKSAKKINIRQRLTKHGGGTITL